MSAIHECPHCGVVLTKNRSGPDHRRFFAMIKAAFAQWPESHDFVPDSKDQLRAWLTCKAGYRNSTPVQLPDGADDNMRTLFRLGIEASIKAAGGNAFVVPYHSGVAVISPKSINWHTLSQKDFGAVRSAVEDVIKAETGLDPDQLLKQTEAAA